MSGQEKDKLAIAIVAVAILIGILFLCGGGALVYYVYQQSVGGPGGEAPRAPLPDIVETPRAEGSEVNQAAAIDAMRPRYVPGPYVEVEGLLPAGLASLRRMSPDAPSAHTLDNPWVVPGAELRNGQMVGGPFEGAPSITLGGHDDPSTPLHVVPGAPTTFAVTAGDGTGDRGEVQGLLISFEGYEGHFYLPAVVDSELGRIQVTGIEEAAFHFGIDAPTTPTGEPAPEGKPLEVTMLVSSQDAMGRVSAPIRRELRVLPLGTGDLEITLTMDRATDLDLYVVGPTGSMVYYGATTGFGAELDLDANAACSRNVGVNNEHVFFGEAGAVAGTYHVRVANYQSCIDDGEVDYRISIRNCGETAVLAGSFVGAGDETVCKGDPGDGRAWCQHVVSFEVTPCRAL